MAAATNRIAEPDVLIAAANAFPARPSPASSSPAIQEVDCEVGADSHADGRNQSADEVEGHAGDREDAEIDRERHDERSRHDQAPSIDLNRTLAIRKIAIRITPMLRIFP